MHTAFARASLFAGVSLVALGLAAPAEAAPTESRASLPLAPDLIEIGPIAGPRAIGTGEGANADPGAALVQPDIFQQQPENVRAIGVSDVLIAFTSIADTEIGASASASVQLSCSVSGLCGSPEPIVQRATDLASGAANALTNAGRIEVGGLARAVGGTAAAAAFVQTAVWQHASGLEASNQLTNSGALEISALADAVATAGSGSAFASLPFGGVTQTAIAAGVSAIAAHHLSNSGSLSIAVGAQASAAAGATASAVMGGGIIQQADGIGSAGASNALANDGAITIDLSASAEGANALASASGSEAIMQAASGRTAQDLISNSGTIAVSVGARAEAATSAVALAFLHSAIEQTAGASGGSDHAAATLTNSGSLSLGVAASAQGSSFGGAEAVLERGLFQIAGAGDGASVAIGNDGDITIRALARAAGASATAYAYEAGGIVQIAFGGSAEAGLTNDSSGMIDISVAGVASATEGNALAFVRLTGTSSGARGIFQVAIGSSAANATLANAGSISIRAEASAEAAGTSASVGGRAIANAGISGAIQQIAQAASGAAEATLVNAGGSAAQLPTISIIAAANGEAQSGEGYANASVAGGLVQALEGVAAHASIVNDGTISIAAVASASGTVAGNDIIISTTSTTFVLPLPGADAYIFNGIVQQAQASAGTAAARAPVGASVTLDNSGSLTISAVADAEADHMALAVADIIGGVGQGVFAKDGSANAALVNGGDIAIVASAQATGSAVAGTGTAFFHTWSGATLSSQFAVPGAYAAVNGGIMQQAVASAGGGRGRTSAAAAAPGPIGGAGVSLDNSGSIDIAAIAGAHGAVLASATATVTDGIVQNAVAAIGDATVTLDNDGTLAIGALASATASGTAFASAYIRPALIQVANDSSKGADALAGDLLTNGGELDVTAVARAVGATATGLASVRQAVFQVAQASFGDAADSIANRGTMSIAAAASVEGATRAIADAGVGGPRSAAIWQTAMAAGGAADDLLTNSGTISLLATARATAQSGWAQAVGHVNNAVAQNAFGAAAMASLANDGTMSITGAGFASGDSATGDGAVAGGLMQFVQATTSVGKPRVALAGSGQQDALASISNSGSIAISGVGRAEATGPAAAVGLVAGALDQFAIAASGSAAASLGNAGEIAIIAAASASGAGAVVTFTGVSSVLGGADAFANVSGAVVQVVDGGEGAAARLDNSGSLSIAAVANAAGAGIATVVGTASAPVAAASGPAATAVVEGAVNQDVSSARGDAAAALANSGSIAVLASAHATSTGAGPAEALAVLLSADLQLAEASAGEAAITLTNSGTLLLENVANAAVTSAASASLARASANLFGGIVDLATGALGASAALENSGSLTIAKMANAANPVGSASAVAVETRVVQQGANAASGDAEATMDNSGTLAIGAIADASGLAAGAHADIATGIAQFLGAQGSASAALSNHGSIAIAASAVGSAVGGPAAAGAGIEGGIGQQVFASGGAVAALDNSGTMAFQAAAHAVAATADGDPAGPAVATARLGAVTFVGIHGVLSQDLSGENAAASLVNSGILSAVAFASASGTSAIAAGNLVDGIRQNIHGLGGDATAVAANSATMSFAAGAVAQATAGDANAVATVGYAIDQDVRASGDALASISNSGAFDVIAQGKASGSGDSLAVAVARGASQDVRGGSRASAEADFGNSGDFAVTALAQAVAGDGMAGTGSSAHAASGSAIASAIGGVQSASAVRFANSGTFSVEAAALASGANAAARANAIGVLQSTGFATGVENAVFSNGGLLDVGARALASGSAGTATASAAAYRFSGTAAGVDGSNSGTLSVAATALAPNVARASARGIMAGTTGSAGTTSGGGSSSSSEASGLSAALASDISGSLTNSGSITVEAKAHADNFAHASAGDGMLQSAIAGTVDEAATNSGTISIAAGAAVTATAFGAAAATAFDGIAQYAKAGSAAQLMSNEGSVLMAAQASAHAGGVAVASALALTAMYQQAFASSIVQQMTNSGTVAVSAQAKASAEGSAGADGAAVASAVALGMGQAAEGAKASQSLTNSGIIKVDAEATAIAPPRSDPADPTSGGYASAFALAMGAHQTNDATMTAVAAFDNGGTIDVHAGAKGSAAGGSAVAVARGYFAEDYGLTTQQVAIDNEGAINVAATATSLAKAYALARGIYIGNAATATSSQAEPIAGTIDNRGTINVVALADGEPIDPDAGPSTFTFGGSSAFATGILVFSGANSLTISNSGAINVDAVAKDGRTAIAMGIAALANGYVDDSGDAVLTINNSGDIIVRQSTDGGETWHRGLAINVAGNPERGVLSAANRSVVNLLGGGKIYGDIALRAQGDDVINVSDGETAFDGIINPVFLPGSGLTEADLDSGLAGVGTLNILKGGSLFLRDRRLDADFADMYDGPSYAFVGTLNVAKGGTLIYELQPAAGGAQAVGGYSQLFAGTANLGGTLVADVTTANGLFADSYSWDNLIDANVLTGKFDSCTLAGPYAHALLLSLTCSYDSNANLDLKLTRTQFDQVAGLNGNGVAVATGLDGYYDVGLTGGAQTMFANLFMITDPAFYTIALNELSGSAYADYLNSFPSLGVHYNDLADRATDCELPALAGSVLECRADGPVHVWGQLDYQSRNADGDAEAGDSRSKRFTGLVGIDTNVGSFAIVGIDGGYGSNRLRDSQFGDSVKGDGWQLGAYAVYDPGPFFLKGVTTYSALNGNSARHINFRGFLPPNAAAFAANPTGSPDVRMWTFGLHGGARFNLGANSVLTPYLDYDYVNARLKSFDERDGNGAGLTVEGGRSNHSYVTGGVKWAMQMGGVVPQVKLGYRYRFGDERSSFHGWFTPDPESDFDIVSSAQKKGTFLAGLSVGGKLGPVDLRVGYEGEFNGDVTSHSGNFKIVLPLGGHAAPPPPPALVAPPPPAPVRGRL
jgi:hypothetical protein